MVNLNIYRFMLLNKAKEQQVLSFYNEEEDLLDTMNDFCEYTHKNIRDYIDNQGRYRTFTLSSRQKIDKDRRIISGHFDSAYTGENGKVKDRETNHLKFKFNNKDLLSKDFFYLIHVPKNSKFGFLIVQKKENHGVKTIFENAFNYFMRAKGVSNYLLELRQAPPRYFIQNFIDKGKLKEFRLIENSQEYGTEEKIFKLNKKSDSEILKKALLDLFSNFHIYDHKISFLDKGEFDEISFVLKFDGTSKTFYIKNKEKIRSNIDVSNLIDFDEGEPTLESLINISLNFISLAS
jgi:hypothetical protein